MIPARYAPVLFGFFLTLIMSAIISGVSTVTTLGLSPELAAAWVRAWLSSWAIAFPSALIVAPVARRIAGRLTAPPP